MPGIAYDSAAWKALEAAVFSDEAFELAMAATKRGEPALCGMDALLTKIIGPYRDKDTDLGPAAGQLVKKLMEVHGYVPAGTGTCAIGSTTKTAIIYQKAS